MFPLGRVHHLFEVQAARTPDACAIVMEGEETVTYRELDRHANRFAHHLRGLGIGSEVVVGICLERSVGGIVSLLAVLKAGGAYLPLDPAYPAERLAYMLENARAPLLITGPEAWPPGDAPDCRQISYREYATAAAATMELDDVPPSDPAGPAVDPLAYVIYTSGSTGKPKGVAMAHGALCNLLHWQTHACPLAAGTAVLQFAPLSFDVSFQEIFSTLSAGGTLVLVPEPTRRDPRGLLRHMDEQNIGRVFLPPVMLGQLAEHSAAGGVLPHELREVITAGEALRITPAVAAFFTALRAQNGRCALHNHYGPTETHVAAAYTLPGKPGTWPALPAIGQPIDGAKIRLLNEDGRPTAPGGPGALHLGGGCLARGYLHNAELTDAKFARDAQGARWYRTGDLAREQPDGNLQFLGRSDDQVKIHGFRVEPGEIETVLSRHPAIREVAVCALSGDASGNQELLACFVPRDPGAVPEPGDLRRWMLGQVPNYLVPAHFAVLERLPLTPSGKVDRRALQPALLPGPARMIAAPPRTPLEKLIARTWEEVLARRHPGVRDVFFEVGGTSLHAMRVHTKLCQELQREFPITALFQHPTIEALAAHLEADNRAADPSASVRERARRQQQQPAASSAAAIAARARLAGVAGQRPG